MVILDMESHELFYTCCPQTVILPISASQRDRTIGVSHQCLAYFVLIYYQY
jgi:hypothetical protein